MKIGYVPWVKNLQTSLSRVVDYKEPLVPIPHIQLIAEASDAAEMTAPSFARRKSLV
jgi:hypothetical protein